MKPILIALSSPAPGSGKSTVATHLVEKHRFTKLAFADPLKRMTVRMMLLLGLHHKEIDARVWGSLKEEEIPHWRFMVPRNTALRMTQAFTESAGLEEDSWYLPIPFAPVTIREFELRLQEFLEGLDRKAPMTSRRFQQLLGTEFGRDMIDRNLWRSITLHKARGWIDGGTSVVIDDMRFPNEYEGVTQFPGYTMRIVRPSIAGTVAASTMAHVSEGQLDHVPMMDVPNIGSIVDLLTTVDREVARLTGLPRP